MKLHDVTSFKLNKEFKETNEVNNKTVLLVDVKVPLYISYLKDIIREVSNELNLEIRSRIDVGEENWLGRDSVYGSTAVVIRSTSKLNDSILEKFNHKLNELSLITQIEVLSIQNFDVHAFRNITEIYDRAVYSCVLNVGSEVMYSLSESKGGWRQLVLQWNGDVVEERVDGLVRISVNTVNSNSMDVYEVIVDAPYGLDITRILEQEFSLKKGSLNGYPVKCNIFYESVDESKRMLGRPLCPVFKSSIERTVGGYVGDTCIRNLLGDKDLVVEKNTIKKFSL